MGRKDREKGGYLCFLSVILIIKVLFIMAFT